MTEKIARAGYMAIVLAIMNISAPAEEVVAQGMDCRTCDNFIGICMEDEDPDDRCYQGFDEEGPFCASWGSIADCGGLALQNLGQEGRTWFATLDPAQVDQGEVADCEGRIIFRRYESDEALRMREMTRVIVLD